VGQTQAVLVIFSGLPGVGKSAIADALGRELRAAVISVDPIEAAILRAGIRQSFETGLAAYTVGAVFAEHQLRLGLTVIADAANYLEVGRGMWRAAADAAGTGWWAIEVVCSDENEHQRRLSARRRQLDPFPEPTWADVVNRRAETEPWRDPRLVVDTVLPLDDNIATAVVYLKG
jgi:predicted kinase